MRIALPIALLYTWHYDSKKSLTNGTNWNHMIKNETKGTQTMASTYEDMKKTFAHILIKVVYDIWGNCSSFPWCSKAIYRQGK